MDPHLAAPLPHTLTIDTKVTQTISGLRYLPRPDVANGRIGSFEITVSTNGTTWGCSGGPRDLGGQQCREERDVRGRNGRYVRLHRDHRGRQPRSLEQRRGDQPGRPKRHQHPAPGTGRRDPGVRPSTSRLSRPQRRCLPGNKLLTWSAYSPTTFGGSNGFTQTSILDLTTGAVSQTQVANTGHDMFCPGTSMLPDGRIMISGGSNSAKTTLYNPGTNTWTAGPAMKIARGYQSNVTTSTGEVFSIGGSWSGGIGNKHGEVWSDAGGWRTLPNVLVDNILTDDPEASTVPTIMPGCLPPPAAGCSTPGRAGR